MRVQVAFQGGGARFVDMLPVVSVLRDLEGEGVLQVSRVSGSSAGSICAALLALKGDVNELRSYAKKNGRTLLKRTSRKFSSTDGEPRIGVYGYISLAMGYPIVSDLKFKNFLSELLSHSISDLSDNETFIEDFLKRPKTPDLFVSAANLAKGRGEFATRGSLVDVIANSCAFPFAIKNYRQLLSSAYIDGGLTENLPTSIFSDAVDEGHKIMVCPIDKLGYSVPKNPISFTSRLLSTAISNQVLRAKGDDGDAMILEVPSSIEIHEVSKAFKNLIDDDWFSQRRNEYRQRLSEFFDMIPADATPAAVLATTLPAPYYRRNLYKIYQNLFSDQNYEIERLAHIVRADCLRKSAGGVRSFDRVEREAIIRTGPKGLSCFRSFAPRQNGVQTPTIWDAQVIDSDGHTLRKLKVVPMPVDPPNSEKAPPGVTMLFFDETKPLDLADERLLVRTINHHQIGVSDLLTDRARDYVNFTHRHHVVAEQAAILLLYPSNFGKIDALDAVKTQVGTSNVVSDEYVKTLGLRVPAEYSIVGRYCTRLASDTKFEVDFVKMT